MIDCWEDDWNQFMSLSEEKRQEMMAKQAEIATDPEKAKEMMAGLKNIFDDADANKDGKLDHAEFGVFMKAMVDKGNEMNGTEWSFTDEQVTKRFTAAEKPEGVTFEDIMAFGKARGEWWKTKMGM